jgi:glycosyltransferase involved in cell wall biosynthesis
MVSVIIPFYNRMELVLQSLKSVQNQTHNNWELILVNDGSTEDVSAIENYIASDNRIKLISANHAGASNARNLGIDSSKGKFIAFLDSDDLWDKEKLEKQLTFMVENNYNVSHTNYNRISVDGLSVK